MAQNQNISLTLGNRINPLNKMPSIDLLYGPYDDRTQALTAMKLYGQDGRQVSVYTDKANGETELLVYNQVADRLDVKSNQKADWTEMNPASEKFIEHKPNQTNFNIYNQNPSDTIIVSSTTPTTIIAATTGSLALPSYSLNDSFIGKLYGDFDNGNETSTITISYKIGNKTYTTDIDVDASDGKQAVSIDYTINFPISRETHITGVIRIGNNSKLIDISLAPPNNIISGLDLKVEATLQLGTLRLVSSYLHRNYN